ncbi:MAG: YlbF/YmcA family competence regulator, partial [Streptococcus lutetiensis]|nr:YlbF/YmcA family competence regulator [Streptococcus lutetiensis]
AKIEANPVLKAYLGAQQSLSVYVADLEKIIFGPLQDLLK